MNTDGFHLKKTLALFRLRIPWTCVFVRLVIEKRPSLSLRSRPMAHREEDVASVKEQLREVHAVNEHLREQLFALHAKRVRMEGYLFKYRSDAMGLFGSSWIRCYFSLVDTCLKCFASEQTMNLIPESEFPVQGYALHWEGVKRKKFWIFGLKDTSGCVVLRLSSTDRSMAQKWIAALEAAGAMGRTPRELPRMKSMPLELRSTPDVTSAKSTAEWPDIVETPSTQAEKDVRRPMVGSTPVHLQNRSSILSSERLFQHPHPGLLNLGVVILFAANFRLVLENVFKYGLRVHPLQWFERLLWGSSQPLMLCWPVLFLCTIQAYLIECLGLRLVQRHAQRVKKTDDTVRPFRQERLLCSLHMVNVLLAFVLPLWLVYISVDAVLPSFVLTFVTMIICMKLISYAHCHADLRRRWIENGDTGSTYLNSITPRHLCYFMFAPTLTYQPSYPRTDRIRGKWLLRRCSELILALALQMAIIDQYIVPAVENSMMPLRNRQFVPLAERVLKLSLPVLYAWLIMFYIFFHLWLNILAEALKFGDREFYKDWWNALNLGDYWRTWNTPVHKWMLRTIYYPAIHLGQPVPSCIHHS